ncbi:hypothetical protein P245_03250 [Comamonas thiooxydans]|uniref:Uncharacterized protein n=1 Tax=Comamonas thiooxydans TaxID=363952 RepID=A0A0E3C7M1_9BURK|nr:hypothetical protein P245_03250 [Comamonas thiooxydans]
MESKVLQIVPSDKLPPPEIACKSCQYATWMQFKGGVKCYCAVTMTWMYEPHLDKNQLVLACDKQMEEEAPEAEPEAR